TRLSTQWREVLPSSTDRNGALPRTGGCRSSRTPVQRSLLHVTSRNLLLGRKLLQGPVLLQLRNGEPQRLSELRIRLAVVDPEGVALGEEVPDGELARMLPLLVRAFGVLAEHCVGASDEQLRDRVRVTRIAREVHLGLSLRFELVVQGLEVELVLRPGLNRDVLAGEVVRRPDVLRVSGLDDQRPVRA